MIIPNEVKTAALIKPQRKSKNKGPKRLGRHSLAREKHLVHDNEMEGMNGKDTLLDVWFVFIEYSSSSSTVPTNTKLVRRSPPGSF